MTVSLDSPFVLMKIERLESELVRLEQSYG